MNSTLLALIITLGIFALFGLLALIENIYDRHKWHRREQAEHARTTGVIVGFAEERHRHGKVRNRNVHYVTVYYPIVLFQVEGAEYELKSTSFVARDKYPEGQSVDLLYDPNNPTHFHLDRGDMEERSTRGAIIFVLVWLTIAVATIIVLLSVNPGLGIQLKRTLYNAVAPLRSAINPSQN